MNDVTLNDIGIVLAFIAGLVSSIIVIKKYVLDPLTVYGHEDINRRLVSIEKKQSKEAELNLLVAKAIVSLATDLQLKGEPNGMTTRDVDALRQRIYSLREDE